VLRVAAGAGAAGVAASALTRIAVPASATTQAHGAHAARQGPDQVTDPVVVHVRDASAGDIDVFRGTSVTRLRDRDLAARIVRASR